METPEILVTSEDKRRTRELLAHISFADAKFRGDGSHNTGSVASQDEDTTDEMKEAMRAIDRHYAAAYGIKLD
ncbi:hypothetical protein FACS1894103_3160 [Campylobacterota bacterium]|nr:hypothetical protein FACS1894103_3160 [Campylobacterota bacterium]